MNALLKFIQCVEIVWIPFVFLSKEDQRLSPTYSFEVIVFQKNMGPAIHIAVMVHHKPEKGHFKSLR
jgi:hypothetical protein